MLTNKVKVVRRKKPSSRQNEKAVNSLLIQFDVVPASSFHCIPLGGNDALTPAYEEEYECSDDDLMIDEYSSYGDRMEKGGRFATGGKPKKKNKLVNLHDESKETKKLDRLRENRKHQKQNIETMLLKNGIKRFGHDIYAKRAETLKPTGTVRGHHQDTHHYSVPSYRSTRPIDPPAVTKHELKRNNIPKEHKFLSQVVDLQHRELTPEDYELLLLLDNTVSVKTVDPQMLRSITEISPASIGLIGEICSVCMESYEVEQKIKRLPCKHYFHSKCIDFWLSNSSLKCPLDGLEVFS